MAIESGKSLGTVAILAADTVLINTVGLDRQVISSGIIHNTTAGVITVNFYDSPDLTSASGSLIASISVGANTQKNITDLIGQSFPVNQNLIAVGTAAGTNSRITVTQYAN